jgi:hypothetical protein
MMPQSQWARAGLETPGRMNTSSDAAFLALDAQLLRTSARSAHAGEEFL